MGMIGVVAGPVGDNQVDILLKRVADSIVTGGSPHLLVPNRQIKQAVRRRLLSDLGRGVGGRAVLTLHEFVHEVAGTIYGSEVREMLWWILSLRKLGRDSLLGSIKQFPNTISAISKTVIELSDGGVEPEELERISGERRTLYRELATLYAESLDAQIIPLQSAMRRAISKLSRVDSTQFSEVGITGFFYFHHAQMKFIEALSGVSEDVTLTIPYEEVRPNVYGLTESNISALPKHNMIEIPRNSFVEDKDVSFLEAETIDDEAASIMVEIKTRLMSGILPERVAVIMREARRYEPLFRRYAREFAVPVEESAVISPAPSRFLLERLNELPVRAEIGQFLISSQRIIDSAKPKNDFLWRELRSTIDELEVHLEDSMDEVITVDEWMLLWNTQRKERENARVSRASGGVRLLDMQQPHWGGYDIVVLPGLVERWFPKPGPIQPFLDDHARSILNKDLVRLWGSKEYRVREELLFTIALDRASSQIILSRPKMDDNGAELNRSIFFEDMISRMIDPKYITPSLETASVRRLLYSYVMGGELPSSASDYLIRDRAKELADLLRRRAIERSRAEGGASIYNGDVGSSVVDTFLRPKWDERGGIAATALERYGRCPFTFFCNDILRLVDRENEEESLLPVSVGTFLHTILHRFYEKRLLEGSGAVKFSNLESALEELDQLSTRILVGYRATHVDMHQSIWDNETSAIKKTLSHVIRKEAEYFEKYGRNPRIVEKKFSVDIPLNNKSFGLRGQIDRVDATDDGELFVIDYKRGKKVGTAADIDKGINLQLPLYMHAAHKILNCNIAGGAYYSMDAAEIKGVLPSYRGLSVGQAIDRALKWAETYINEIRNGRFPVRPKLCVGTSCGCHRLCRLENYKEGLNEKLC